MRWFLRIIAGQDAGHRVELAGSAMLLVGRGADCGLRLSDPGASRVHCRIVTSAGKAFIEDAGSRWGTLVNNQPIETHELLPGDRIVVGDTELQFEIDDPVAKTRAPVRQLEPTRAAQEPARAVTREHASPPRTVNFEGLVGQQFLRFRVGNMIARTRSGAVYRAFDPGRATERVPEGNADSPRDRLIALKIFAPESLGDDRATRRFLRAIRAMLPLQHENLVRLHTAGRWQGICFAASEFVDGESATQIIQRVGIAGMLDWRRVWRIAAAVAAALEYAHARGIIHRNVAPGHILIDRSGETIKLGDLMLAKALEDCSERITRPGEVVGNLHYLAPEQLAGDAWIDGRADLYSLGATLYALLSGRPPHDGATPGEIIRAVLTGRPEPPSRRQLGIPAAFESVVMKLLARSTDDRYPSASDLLRELHRAHRHAGVEC